MRRSSAGPRSFALLLAALAGCSIYEPSLLVDAPPTYTNAGSTGDGGTEGDAGEGGTEAQGGDTGTAGTEGEAGMGGTEGVAGEGGTEAQGGDAGAAGDTGVGGDAGEGGAGGEPAAGTGGTGGTGGKGGSAGTGGKGGTGGTAGKSGAGGGGASGAGTGGMGGESGAAGTAGSGGSGECSGKVLINEVSIEKSSSVKSDELVELFNPNGCEVQLEGWTLKYAASSATAFGTVAWTGSAGSSIPPGALFVIGSQMFLSSGGTGDLGKLGLSTPAGIGLFPKGAADPVDKVAWGGVDVATHPAVESAPAASPASGKSIGRNPASDDTDNNAADFTEQARSPGEINPLATPPMSRPTPLGPVKEGAGHRFTVLSRHAEAVSLALFDERGVEQRVPMERVGDLFTVYIPGAAVGQRYGFRAEGRYAPAEGHRFQPAKLLLDPYARRVDGAFSVRGELFDYAPNEVDPDTRDSAAHVPRSVVIDHAFDWGDDVAPRIPLARTVVYEAHVKGLTRLHPDVPEAHRGTFLGLGHDAVIDHLKALGVTAVELLPIQQGVLERHLATKRLPNYWGYNTIAPFAPDSRFAVSDPVIELKTAIKRLHARGLEIILDVVFNHTGEGDDRGTTVGLRGLDGPTYYRREQGKAIDWTGTGNTLNLGDPAVRAWVLDCLRAWVVDYHVDGFRFDLGVCLGREKGPFDPRAALLDALVSDPVLAGVKRIVEPWDLGPDGYQVGRFPNGFVEWNGEYRDTVRRFFRGDRGMIGALATRICGSSDRYTGARGPLAGVSFVTAHDGFTLRDLVSFEEKHNEANGEQNADGHEPNFARNFGTEGDTGDPAIVDRRMRVAKSLVLTLACSQGVPMILGGDELLRSQQGNNNAYCQDHPGVYTKWDSKSPLVTSMLAFFRAAFAARTRFDAFHRATFFAGQTIAPGVSDVAFYTRAGQPLTTRDWDDETAQSLVVTFGEPTGGELLLALNGGDEALDVRLPARPSRFEVVVATDEASRPSEDGTLTLLPGGSALLHRS